jgi:transposase-like protein
VVAGRAKRGPTRRYSDEDRSSALAKLAENGGDVSKTAAQLGIPERTLNHWANGDGIHPDVARAAEGKKADLAARWERVANAALDVLDKSSGELRPRDAATVGGIATDKMLLLRGDTPPAGGVIVIKVVSGDWVSDL